MKNGDGTNAKIGNVRETVGIGRVVGQAQHVACLQLGRVLEDGRFEFAELFQLLDLSASYPSHVDRLTIR